MAIGRVNTGGGAALNFKVVGGTTQPSNPKENTLWVNTPTAITDWLFAVAFPTTRTDGTPLSGGEVYFKVGTAATAPINMLKKFGAFEYPQASYQYINGSWVSKTAKTYQNSAWVDWTLYLFNQGDVCQNITGGWNLVKSNPADLSTLSFTNNVMTLTSRTGTENSNTASAVTANRIDLTDKSTIRIKDVSTIVNQINYNRSIVYVSSEIINYIQNISGAAAYLTMSASNAGNLVGADFSLDVSSLSGTYYVGVMLDGFTSVNTLTCKQIILE